LLTEEEPRLNKNGFEKSFDLVVRCSAAVFNRLS